MTTKKIQFIITVVLGLLLILIVGGYIYFGMYLAQKADVTESIPAAEATPSNPPRTLTSDEKMKILQSLQDTATDTPSSEEKQKVLNSLSADNGPTLTESQKNDILNSLKTQTEPIE
jgi:hypothetical protein